MGCGYEMACWDCGVKQDVGYGSHTTWLTANTVAEWFERAKHSEPEVVGRHKNLCVLEFLMRHAGHRCEAISEYIADCDPSEEYTRYLTLRDVEAPEYLKPLFGRG